MAAESKKKKRVIALLLLLSCIVSSVILFAGDFEDYHRIEDLAAIDSVVQRQLDQYYIGEEQIQVTTTEIDTLLTRKNYRIAVPATFSKTQLHADLNELLYRYNLRLPSRVTLPENDMRIHLVLNHTVVRTIVLRSDPELVKKSIPASIMVAFTDEPSAGMVDDVVDLGEPIPLVLAMDDPIEAKEYQKRLSNTYPYITYWLKQGYDGSGDGNNRSREALFPKLQHLQKMDPDATVLSLDPLDHNRSDEIAEAIARSRLRVVDASRAIVLDAREGRRIFAKKINQFEQEAHRWNHPIAVIIATPTAVEWLKEILPDLKKGGMVVTLPPNSSL
ncbi:MAG: hypothetical protein R3211_09885 [Balneolaceae bacterium]|nr:hypothetical protein [Balneolaceae bacterium]